MFSMETTPPETAIGAEELDLSEIQDVVLSMEYETPAISG